MTKSLQSTVHFTNREEVHRDLHFCWGWGAQLFQAIKNIAQQSIIFGVQLLPLHAELFSSIHIKKATRFSVFLFSAHPSTAIPGDADIKLLLFLYIGAAATEPDRHHVEVNMRDKLVALIKAGHLEQVRELSFALEQGFDLSGADFKGANLQGAGMILANPEA